MHATASQLPTVHAVSDFRQGLAAARIRQWAKARQQMKAGHRPIVVLPGRQSHKNRSATADAAIVCALDFERALSKLPLAQQTLLLLKYRDGQPVHMIAAGLGVSVRTVDNWLPIALDALADALELEEFL